MKKLLVMMLVSAMSMAMLTGCNADSNGAGDGQNAEGASDVIAEEVVSMDETQESETAEAEVSEEVSEMTLEEKILAEMPAKLEVGEDEIIVPETVTAEQIMSRWEEIKVSDHEYAERINGFNLAGMLVLNCSYMEPAEFNSLVNEHFGNMEELWACYDEYYNYLYDANGMYGTGLSVVPEELFFDEYLIYQAEQIHSLIGMYQADKENSKEYYNIMMNYLFYDENILFTFDYNDERLQGSGLACLQQFALVTLFDDIVEYDTELYLNDNVFVDANFNVRDIVEDHANQTSR